MAKLEISLLGSFQVLLNGAPVTAFESVKVRALLAYLAAEYARPHSRESLATLLWPDWPQQSAMRNLRNALTDLRKVIGDRDVQPPFLLVARDSIQLNSEADVWVDVIEFQQGVRDRGQGDASINQQSTIRNLQSAIALFRGPFLDGFSSPDSAPFEEWILAKREYFSQQMLKALSRLAEWSIQQGEYEHAEGYARRQIELEPWREQAYQQLMRAMSLKGERVQALAQFESLKKALQRELKVEPSVAMVTLYQQIRDGEQQGKRDKGIREASSPSPLSPDLSLLPHHNLPLQLTSFIGREKEIEAVQRLLQNNRLVTLTGPGGTGKTRLALQTASSLLDRYVDGVWLIELAPLSDPALVPTLAGRALGLYELAGSQMVELLQDYLEPLQVLLIFDNCEHVIEACARLTTTLLQTCPRLTILASSREALGIPGEVPFRVPPLSLPDVTPVLPPIETLAHSEAIRLFDDRAATVSPEFALTQGNASAILQICQRLDGIPLAIELAAARVRLLQVDEIARRLDDRFRLLTGGSRAALERYQTLRASIDWSYGLLSEPERKLLQHLSVFASGWVLQAAEAVGCGDGIQSCDVLEMLGLLVDKSLVNAGSEPGNATWYRMLETIRQYAHEKLVEDGQAETARHQHLQYYLELAERVENKIRGPDQATILDRLEAELDNLRLALAWSLGGKGKPGWDPEPGLRLASALHWFWHSHGRSDEGIQWLEQLLAAEAEERGSKPYTAERIRYRARALFVASMMASFTKEHFEAVRLSTESRQLYQSLGAEGRVGSAWTWYTYDDPSKNQAEISMILEQALAILREAGDIFGVSEFLGKLGSLALQSNNYERAKAYLDDALVLKKEIGDLEGLGGVLLTQTNLADYKGEYQQSRILIEECKRIFSATHSDSFVGYVYKDLAEYDTVDGNYPQATVQTSKALSIGRRLGDISLIHFGHLLLSKLAILQEQNTEATDQLMENLVYFRKKDHKVYIQDTLLWLGRLSWVGGDFEQAFRMFTDALTIYGEVNHTIKRIALRWLGKVSFARGELDEALVHYKQALGMPRRFYSFPTFIDDLDIPMGVLEDMAILAAGDLYSDVIRLPSDGQAPVETAAACSSVIARSLSAAARLLGVTETWHQRFFHTRLPRERREREACVAAVRAAMGEKAYAAAFAEGQAMNEEQATAYARGYSRLPNRDQTRS